MSRWLQRALADIGTPASVPIAPLAPIGPPAQAIGTIGTNGTGAAMAEEWQAHYEERAAIRQFDGGLPKWEAEALAFNETTAALGRQPTGLSLCPRPRPPTMPSFLARSRLLFSESRGTKCRRLPRRCPKIYQVGRFGRFSRRDHCAVQRFALSRRKHGFESVPRERQQCQILSSKRPGNFPDVPNLCLIYVPGQGSTTWTIAAASS